MAFRNRKNGCLIYIALQKLKWELAVFFSPCTDTTRQAPNKFRVIVMWHENI